MAIRATANSLLVLCVVVVLFFLVIVGYEIVRCGFQNIDREEALSIANNKLEKGWGGAGGYFNLTNERFEDGLWAFYFKNGECEIVFTVDACGVVDVGGVSEKCVRANGR